MRHNLHPLHPSQIRPAEPVYQVDCSDRTQETLERRAQQTHPTMRTTRGDSRWRWGRRVHAPTTTSVPAVFSPSDLDPQRRDPAPAYGTPDEARRRLQGR